MLKIYILIVMVVLFTSFSSAAHFIVGVVNNSLDGNLADGHTILMWNPSNGMSDNLTDIIGPSGNSGSNNIYLMDCELLTSPCNVGDILNIKVIDNGDGYLSNNISLMVTGAGFDIANDLVLDSPPVFLNISVDDNINIPLGEIDLNPGSTKNVRCNAILRDYENDSIISINSTFFDSNLSNYASLDDNNNHYSNSSCFINSTYGTNMTFVECGFNLQYYANSNNWNCTMRVVDALNATRYGSNNTYVNKLLAISLPESIDYGVVASLSVSNESTINISNYGNSILNISLEGYAVTRGDNLSMNCTLGAIRNISIYYEKYNLTRSNTSYLTLSQFEDIYSNLTSNSVVKRFNLNYRQNDLVDDATNSTYWRIYVPAGVAGSCSGNIIFGARTFAGN